MPLMFTTAINMQNPLTFEVSGDPCYNSHTNSGTETYATSLSFIW